MRIINLENVSIKIKNNSLATGNFLLYWYMSSECTRGNDGNGMLLSHPVALTSTPFRGRGGNKN